MGRFNLETTYRQYIACLNERRFENLDDYVVSTVTHNGKSMTWEGYSDMIAASTTAMPDLFFDIHLLVVNDEQQFLACRIQLTGTLQHRFLDWEPSASGNKIVFSEHVFYKFRDGKIEEVWSLLDSQSVKEQLSSG